MVASQTTSISPRLSETWRSLVIIALAALLIAASWRGVSDTKKIRAVGTMPILLNLSWGRSTHRCRLDNGSVEIR